MPNASLLPILRPRSVAVIGASRSVNTIGHEIVSNLVRYGFTGPVYPINPSATSVNSIRAYPSVSVLPEAPDLAVVAVPKQHVASVAEECGQAGVKGLVVISAGFREVGGEGRAREQELVEIVRRHNMRMIGPNCMGVLNADPAVSMNATFAPSMPPFGRVGFMTQSGAMGLSVLDYAQEYGIGIAQFVSMGNKANTSGNDILLAWEDDPAIGVILMYVENFGNPRRFLEIASRITKHKPIIAVKSGRSRVGARAASSHTGALAASDAAVDALLAQAGVLRAGSVEELFDLAMAFSGQPLPASRRTAVLTNSGGPGILAADALEAAGLDVTELDRDTADRLRSLFPAEASVRNPLDMIASATPATYRAALDGLLSDPQVDSVVAIFVPPLGIRQADVAEAIARAAADRPEKPILAVLMGREGLPQGKAELHEVRIPAYIFPESAARALSSLCRYREWCERPAQERVTLPMDKEKISAILARARKSGIPKLPEHETLALLAACGIRTAPGSLVSDVEEAVRSAEAVGYPVVLKIVSPDIVHKTDVGGVRVDLGNAQEVRDGYRDIMEAVGKRAPEASVTGILVQRMVRGGREMIAGLSRDPSFGPMVMFGLGGVLVEVLRDVAFRLAPMQRADAHDMVRAIRGFRMLQGVRGEPPSDLDAVEEVLLRISQLAIEYPEIAELDVNPLLASAEGAIAADGRILLGDTT